jgi:hypothetical protein
LKRSLVLVLIVLACALAAAAPAATTAAPTQTARAPLALAHACSSSRYKHAIIDGEHKCLGSGQFCATRYESIYRRHGFTCKRGPNGRLRLYRK